MSPIRESERHRYPPPKEWRAIRARIMERAENRCECKGECGLDHEAGNIGRDPLRYPSARCGIEHGNYIARSKSEPWHWLGADDVEAGRSETTGRIDDYAETAHRVVLTTAHLNHDPSDNRPANLRAFCQLCHLRYDRHEHAKNAQATRRGRKAVGELPGVE